LFFGSYASGTNLALSPSDMNMRSLRIQIEEVEKRAIIAALEDCGWVMARAARRLGITERMISYRIRKYGIRKEVNGSASVKEWTNTRINREKEERR